MFAKPKYEDYLLLELAAISDFVLTDDEVYLRAECERQIFVTHEVVHLKRLDDTHFGHTLA